MALCSQFPLLLSADPGFPGLQWRGAAERGMLSPPVMERLDGIEQISLRSGPRNVASTMPPLALQAVDDALGRRVFPAISLAAHRADHPALSRPCLKGMARVLGIGLPGRSDESGLAPASCGTTPWSAHR